MPLRRAIVLLAWLSASSLLATACSKGPEPEIIGVTAHDAAPDFDYTVWVDCTVRNNGDDGSIEVSASLTGGGRWIKRDTVFVAENSERKVTLEFPEVELLGAGPSGYEYNCSAQ